LPAIEADPTITSAMNVQENKESPRITNGDRHKNDSVFLTNGMSSPGNEVRDPASPQEGHE
jgi:hypothetical protein